MRRVRYRPSRLPSAMGLVVGVAFVCIGLFIVIPAAGPFGILWTIMALAITIANGINVFSSRGIASGEFEIEEDHPIDFEPVSGRAQARLTELKNLYDRRLITREEYEAKRAEILKDL